jgi:hypothetical protein
MGKRFARTYVTRGLDSEAKRELGKVKGHTQ